MGFLLLVIVCGLYYVVYFTSVMYSGGLKLLQLIVYAVAFILYLIPFFFIKEEYYNIQNYMLILNMGVAAYAWMAIKGFWSKPLKLKREQLINKTQGSISKEQYEDVESLTIIIEAAKYKGIISIIISFIFMISMTHIATPRLRKEFLIGNTEVWIFCFLLLVIYVIVDIILWIKRGKFAFISIRPLFLLLCLVILEGVLLIH